MHVRNGPQQMRDILTHGLHPEGLRSARTRDMRGTRVPRLQVSLGREAREHSDDLLDGSSHDEVSERSGRIARRDVRLRRPLYLYIYICT